MGHAKDPQELPVQSQHRVRSYLYESQAGRLWHHSTKERTAPDLSEYQYGAPLQQLGEPGYSRFNLHGSRRCLYSEIRHGQAQVQGRCVECSAKPVGALRISRTLSHWHWILIRVHEYWSDASQDVHR